MKTAVINNGISEDFETCCRVMHDSGIAHVEIQRVDNVPVESCVPAQAVEWRRSCERYGIAPVCVTTHAFGGVPVDTLMATVDFRPLGRGMIAPYLDDLAAALQRDKYGGCVSLESVYKPDGGDVLDGYRANLPRFLQTFS